MPYGGSSANFHEIQFEGVHLMTTLCEVKMSKTRQGKYKSCVSACCVSLSLDRWVPFRGLSQAAIFLRLHDLKSKQFYFPADILQINVHKISDLSI